MILYVGVSLVNIITGEYRVESQYSCTFYKLLTFKNTLAAKKQSAVTPKENGGAAVLKKICAINAAELNTSISSQINAVRGMSKIERLLPMTFHSKLCSVIKHDHPEFLYFSLYRLCFLGVF